MPPVDDIRKSNVEYYCTHWLTALGTDIIITVLVFVMIGADPALDVVGMEVQLLLKGN